jgi:hypothetical protein
LQNWNSIDENYRPTCKKIIFYAFNHELFEESEIAKQILMGWWGQKDDISKSMQSLVDANILSDFGDGTYSLHSKVEKAYLVGNMNKLR